MATFTPTEAARRLNQFARRDLSKAIINGFRRGITDWRKDAIRSFTTRGVGRGIFGRRPTGAGKLFKRTRAMVSADGLRLTAGLEVKGFAALQEQGGRTKAHPIPRRPKTGSDRLVFQGRQGLVVIRQVKHPGSRVPAIPYLRATAERALPGITQDIDRTIQAAVDQQIG